MEKNGRKKNSERSEKKLSESGAHLFVFFEIHVYTPLGLCPMLEYVQCMKPNFLYESAQSYKTLVWKHICK